MEKISLKNKVVVITGAGSGIGRIVAITLAKEGAHVVCLGRTEQTLKETVSSIRKNGNNCDFYVCDVSKPESVEQIFSVILERFGVVDILINNAAAFGSTASIEEQSVGSWMDCLLTNVLGPATCIKEVLPGMKSRKSGYILNVSSLATSFAYTERAPYGTTKAALEYLTKVTAAEVASCGIIVNAIAPGHIKGERLDKVIQARAESHGPVTDADVEKARKAFLRQYKLKLGDETAILDPEDVAEQILFLLTSNAGKKITGEVIPMKCGFRL